MSTDVSSAENEGGAPIRTARVPKYYRLKKHLLDMTETLPPGTPVPPERTLAAEFDTSRTTVRQALQELVVEGRLERIQGKGTFVAKPKVSQALQLTLVPPRTCAPRALNPPRSSWTSATSPPTTPSPSCSTSSAGGRVLRIERLRLASGEPMAIETTHLSAKRFRPAPQPGEVHVPLHRARRGVRRPSRRGRGDHRDLAGHPREAGLLGTDVGLPMLMLSGTRWTGRASRWMRVRSVYRGDRYKFVARLKRRRSSAPAAYPDRDTDEGFRLADAVASVAACQVNSEGTESPYVRRVGRARRAEGRTAGGDTIRVVITLCWMARSWRCCGSAPTPDRPGVHRHPVLLLVPDAVGARVHGAHRDRVPAVAA